jgi:hypothetical protein
MRIDAYEGLWPKSAVRVNRIHLNANVVGANLGERSRKTFVVRNQGPIEIKNVHAGLLWPQLLASHEPDGGRGS